jgi:hypothetical protein
LQPPVSFISDLSCNILSRCAGTKTPLVRVAQAFVIATSTSVDINGINTANVTDALIAGPKVKKSKTFIKDQVCLDFL